MVDKLDDREDRTKLTPVTQDSNTFGKLDLKMRQTLSVTEGAELGQHCPSSRRLGVQIQCPRNSLCRDGLLVTLRTLEEGRWWKTHAILPLPLHSLV